MKKRTLIILCMMVLASGSLLFGGCTKEDKSIEKESVEKKEEKKEEVQEEDLALIGTEAEGEGIYKVTLENKTGKDIVGVSVKDSSMTDYPANMLPEGEVFTMRGGIYIIILQQPVRRRTCSQWKVIQTKNCWKCRWMCS